jgi:hypothetical protein
MVQDEIVHQPLVLEGYRSALLVRANVVEAVQQDDQISNGQ